MASTLPGDDAEDDDAKQTWRHYLGYAGIQRQPAPSINSQYHARPGRGHTGESDWRNYVMWATEHGSIKRTVDLCEFTTITSKLFIKLSKVHKNAFFSHRNVNFFSGERAKPPPQTTLPLGEKHPSRLLSWHSATRPGVTRIFVALETW